MDNREMGLMAASMLDAKFEDNYLDTKGNLTGQTYYFIFSKGKKKFTLPLEVVQTLSTKLALFKSQDNLIKIQGEVIEAHEKVNSCRERVLVAQNEALIEAELKRLDTIDQKVIDGQDIPINDSIFKPYSSEQGRR